MKMNVNEIIMEHGEVLTILDPKKEFELDVNNNGCGFSLRAYCCKTNMYYVIHTDEEGFRVEEENGTEVFNPNKPKELKDAKD